MKQTLMFSLLNFILFSCIQAQPPQRLSDYGVKIGVLPKGPNNAITDVGGVLVGHATLLRGDSVRTGVTAILPHNGNIFQDKVPAAMYLANGFGKLMGYSQVEELGNIETPIVLTNTLSVPTAATALINFTLGLPQNESVRSVNPIVGETNDGWLNDIRGQHVREKDVQEAIVNAADGKVREGGVGAGTGTSCFGFKGGIGTASRKLPKSLGGYTVGVLVQSNFGGVLQIAGAPVGVELGEYYFKSQLQDGADGSCMIVVATDAPLDARNLKRLAKRAMFGLAKTGGIASNGSGDYVIAFSTAEHLRIPYQSDSSLRKGEVLRNEAMSPLFLGVIEATEEAILNSLVAARDTKGHLGHERKALPMNKVVPILRKYGLISR